MRIISSVWNGQLFDFSKMNAANDENDAKGKVDQSNYAKCAGALGV